MLCVASIIFASASPLFPIEAKILTCSLSTILIIYLSERTFKLKTPDFISVVFIFLYLTLVGSIVDLGRSNYISPQGVGFAFLICLGFLLSQAITRDEFFRANEALVKFTLILGLPIHLVTIMYPGIIDAGVTYRHGEELHVTFFVTHVYLMGDEVSRRFVGFASEPGLSQVFYLMAIYSRSRENGGRIDWLIGMILLAIFLSRSTFGIVMVGLVSIISFGPVKTCKYIVLASPLIMTIVIDEFAYHLTSKLVGSESFGARYDRYSYLVENDLVSLAFGRGNVFYSETIAPSDLGGWDSFLQVVQRYGLFFMLYVFSCLLLNNIRNYAGIVFIISTAFFAQSIWILPAVSFFYFAGLSKPRGVDVATKSHQ